MIRDFFRINGCRILHHRYLDTKSQPSPAKVRWLPEYSQFYDIVGQAEEGNFFLIDCYYFENDIEGYFLNQDDKVFFENVLKNWSLLEGLKEEVSQSFSFVFVSNLSYDERLVNSVRGDIDLLTEFYERLWTLIKEEEVKNMNNLDEYTIFEVLENLELYSAKLSLKTQSISNGKTYKRVLMPKVRKIIEFSTKPELMPCPNCGEQSVLRGSISVWILKEAKLFTYRCKNCFYEFEPKGNFEVVQGLIGML